MKLGTHNSLSYMRCQWWLEPFAWIGRCQSMTIKEQFLYGVRYFDIRVKFVNGVAKSGHGLLTYDILIDDVLGLLQWYYTKIGKGKEEVIVRLFLENSKHNPTLYAKEFMMCIEKWKEKYPELTFIEGGCRYDYKSYIDYNIPVRVCYAEYWKKKLCIPWPKHWAKKHNKGLHEGDNSRQYSVYDYIQYGINK